MKSLRYTRSRASRPRDVNLTPLIDMVFILLIFFLVTTSFVRESGVDVRKPSARTVTTKEKNNLMVGVTEEGRVYIEGRVVDIRSVRARMERFLAEMPEGSVVVVADRASRTGAIVQVIDACRLAGVTNISLAADKVRP